MPQKNSPVAVFDSGVGGISVLRELVRLMPNERYLYYGDSANAPYGTRPTSEVKALTLAAGEMLIDRGAKALVVACNTATAAAIDDLRQLYPNRVIIGIEPALKLAADHFPTARVAVLATPVTLREEKFAHLQERFPKMEVTSIPLPGLVELVEQGSSDEEVERFLRPILSPYAGLLDAAVLGCTHYPLVGRIIGKLLQSAILLDGGKGTAMQTQRRLAALDLLSDGPGEIQIENSSLDPALISRCMQLLKDEK